jgi:hypothetical protein
MAEAKGTGLRAGTGVSYGPLFLAGISPFYLAHWCFALQLNSGDECLAICCDRPLGSISFGRLIRDKGRDAAPAYLDRLRATTLEPEPGHRVNQVGLKG